MFSLFYINFCLVIKIVYVGVQCIVFKLPVNPSSTIIIISLIRVTWLGIKVLSVSKTVAKLSFYNSLKPETLCTLLTITNFSNIKLVPNKICSLQCCYNRECMEGNYLYNHVSKCIAIKLVIRMTIFIYFDMGLFIFEKREYRAQGQTP